MTSTKVIDRLRQVLRRQHKALSTEDSYSFWLRRYISAVRRMPKDLSSERKLEPFLTELALRDNVAASTQNQAFNSVVFFYKEALGQPLGNVDALCATRPVHERHAPSIPETRGDWTVRSSLHFQSKEPVRVCGIELNPKLAV